MTAFFWTTIVACSGPQFSDKNIEARAINITQMLDSNSINVFKEWSYGIRGQAEIWSKLSFDSSLYACLYINNLGTIKLSIGQLENFKKDFPCDFLIDTSKYHRTIFSKINDTTISIMAIDNQGHDHILSESIPLKSVFRTSDPFKHFKSLSDFKDSLGIIGTFYRPDIGNFIELYLSAQHILTYLPDIPKFNPRFKYIWIKEFETGKTIKKNWNLRKLDKPRDDG